MEHTKGKVKIQNDLRIKNESNQIICDFYSFSEGIANKEAIANAKLTTDAFNTTNESGLTPSQLYKQNQELLELINKSIKALSYYDYGNLVVMKYELEQAINNAKTK